MEYTLTTLSAISHNTSGWAEDKAGILNTVLAALGVPVFAIQEHMQMKSNLYKVASKFPN